MASQVKQLAQGIQKIYVKEEQYGLLEMDTKKTDAEWNLVKLFRAKRWIGNICRDITWSEWGKYTEYFHEVKTQRRRKNLTRMMIGDQLSTYAEKITHHIVSHCKN